MNFFYVYILESKSSADHFYVGFTTDLKDRLRRHNAGDVPHTVKSRPWQLKTAVAFTDPVRAIGSTEFLKGGEVCPSRLSRASSLERPIPGKERQRRI